MERELTQKVLDKAIELFKVDNPDYNWEDVKQEDRWHYINIAHGSSDKVVKAEVVESEPAPKKKSLLKKLTGK